MSTLMNDRSEAAQGQSPASRSMSFEEFLEWVDEDAHVEWVNGKVVPMAPINDEHADVSSFLLMLLLVFFLCCCSSYFMLLLIIILFHLSLLLNSRLYTDLTVSDFTISDLAVSDHMILITKSHTCSLIHMILIT